MTAPALTALIAKWRMQSVQREDTALTAGDSMVAESLSICAHELETALAGIGEASASSPKIAELRLDLWRIAGTVVAACDSGNVEFARLACMEGSPLVGEAREVIAKHGLSNLTIVDAITGEVRP